MLDKKVHRRRRHQRLHRASSLFQPMLLIVIPCRELAAASVLAYWAFVVTQAPRVAHR
jgi:hypothetical protein